MDTLISVASVHEAVCLSVPYDMTSIIQAFYSYYTTFPSDKPYSWGEEFDSQKHFMTLTEVFTYLSLKTQELEERDTILERMIGHLSGRCKVPYDEIRLGAHSIFEKK